MDRCDRLVAIGVSSGLIHLPFGERPGYGSPYPEGIAVGHIDQEGDATGNPITATFLDDGHFMHRLELAQYTEGQEAGTRGSMITAHRWASDRSGLGATAFDLNWLMEVISGSTANPFTQNNLEPSALAMVRRFPIGRTDNVDLQILISIIASNQNTIAFDFNVVTTYWRQEALYRPGFLQSFWEAPFVPPATLGLG